MGTHPIFESDFDCLTVLERKRKMSSSIKSKRFDRRRAGRAGRKGTGVAPEVLDEVLKKEGVIKDHVDGEEARVDDAINTSIHNRDLNEPINADAIQAEFTPVKSFTRTSHRYSATEEQQRETKEHSPYALKTKATNNNEPKPPPPPPALSSDEDDDECDAVEQQQQQQQRQQHVDDDLKVQIEDLEDEIDELRLQLRQKDTVIAEKDLEISRLKRSARRTRQPARQSDF